MYFFLFCLKACEDETGHMTLHGSRTECEQRASENVAGAKRSPHIKHDTAFNLYSWAMMTQHGDDTGELIWKA